MMRSQIESDLSEALARLRERLARVETEVGHLSHANSVHIGSRERMAVQLAHIAASLQDAHRLIGRMQADLNRMAEHPHLEEMVQHWWPALLGIVMIIVTVAGRDDLAKLLIGLR